MSQRPGVQEIINSNQGASSPAISGFIRQKSLESRLVWMAEADVWIIRELKDFGVPSKQSIFTFVRRTM
jgi:hypothetical protein